MDLIVVAPKESFQSVVDGGHLVSTMMAESANFY